MQNELTGKVNCIQIHKMTGIDLYIEAAKPLFCNPVLLQVVKWGYNDKPHEQIN